MATFNKYNVFVENLAEGVHNLQSDTLKIALTARAPVATDTVYTGIREIWSGNGYFSGGNTATLSSSAQTAGVYKLTLNDPGVWTGGPSAMSGFRYAILYNDTPTSPADPLIGYWDYGSTVTLNSGETFTVDLDQSNGTITIQ